MTDKEMGHMKLRQIKTADQLPENAAYYSTEYERRGRNHTYWYALYDKDFKQIENVEILYTNALSGLSRIARADQVDAVIYLAYDLEKLNDDFYAVRKNEDTCATLKDMCDAVKPKNWK